MSDLSERLAALTPEQRAQITARLQRGPAAPARPVAEPIAVLSVGCRFPGGANTPEAFWERLCNGFDAIRPTPVDLSNGVRDFSADTNRDDRTQRPWGGFLDRVDQLDDQFFGLSPREIVHMDPQQRMLLETAWEALEDAGQMTDALAGSPAGVFIGAQSHSSDYYSLQARHRERLDTYTATGTAHSILANRLSFLLDLRGPSLTVDTACSSSLVAIHLACQSLRSAECDLAVAGGVNLILTPDLQTCLNKLELIAPDGRCKSFDHRANGFVRGEGCGVVVLKRLSEALRDHDPVLAVIAGSAMNQDGASNGLTAPNGPAQEAVVRRSLELARIAPERVSYIETHGTGTALGDPIEVEALGNVLGRGATPGRRCILGALKTNLGHLEAASGVAGLIKVILCLKHGAIPPNLHFEKLNPLITLAGTRFVLPTELTPWPRSAEPRFAGVSSFGFGGTNAHVTLTESPTVGVPSAPVAASADVARLLPISARTGPALRDLATSYRTYLKTDAAAAIPPAAVAATASLRRIHHDHRWCVVGAGPAEWVTALDEKLRTGAAITETSDDTDANLVFAYSGQGSQWPTMGAHLLKTEAVFRESVERCAAEFRKYASWSLLEELQAPASRSRLDQTEIAQPAIFALQVGLTTLWQSWGIRPAAVVGHSVGEVAAAHAAGVLSLEDAARVVFHRGRLMQAATGRGAMAAVGISPDAAERLLESCRDRVVIAAINSPASVVLSGEESLIDGFVADLTGQGIFARRLAVDYAFHSPAMEPFAAELARSLHGLQVSPAQIPIVSTVSGQFAALDDFSAKYWARNVRQTVRFADAMQTLLSHGSRLFVEVGPHPVLCPAMAQCEPVGGGALTLLPSLQRNQDVRRSLLESLARLHVAGCRINWPAINPDQGRCETLPRYPWQRQRFWLPPVPDDAAVKRVESVVEPHQSDGPPADWFYSVDWLPHSNLKRNGSHASALENVNPRPLLSALGPQLPEFGRTTGNDQLLGLRHELDRLSATTVFATLAGLGAPSSAGSVWQKQGLVDALRILPRFERLVTRLGEILTAAGRLRDDGPYWTVLSPSPTPGVRTSAELVERLGEARDILQLHDRCGQRLGDVLRGECDPLSLLFSEDEKSSAEAVYRDAAPSRLGNQLAAEAIQGCVAQLAANRTLRVLELGAGTGGTTSAVLPLLPPDRTEYVFTDLSPLFLRRAAEKFASYPFLRYEIFDLEQSPADQGFGLGQFDLIIAANVVHATRDLGVSLDHARQLLAPGGTLLLLECTAPRPWMDITFGLTEGWWRFTDRHLRDAHPLLPETAWVTLLGKCGFRDATALPLQPPDTALFDQALIVARRAPIASTEEQAAVIAQPSQSSASHTLIFAEDAGLADELRLQLEARGDRCSVVRPGATFTVLSAREFTASFESPEDIQQVLERAQSGYDSVVYLAGSDHDPNRAPDLVGACQRPLRLLQRLLANGPTSACRVWLVTRGSQPGAAASGASALANSLLWGLGRGAALEAPGLSVRLVDLDPGDEPAQAVRALLAELDDPDQEDQVALRRQQRFVPRLKRADGHDAPSADLRVAGTHLVTGGLGSLGGQLALHLANAGAEHLVLVVKRPLPERSEWTGLAGDSPDAARVEIVRQLEATGARVTVATVDLTDALALSNFFRSLPPDAPPLRGVWHTAMSLSSAQLATLGSDAVRKMIEVKAHAAWSLHELTRDAQLDQFVLFSSTTALWGAAGLAHYAAANSYLDALAHFRRARNLPATVINWGTWERTDRPAALESDRAARVGIRPMPAPLALKALSRILADQTCQAVVADVDWNTFKAAYEWRGPRPFLDRIDVHPAAISTRAEQPQREQSFIDRLNLAAEPDRRALLTAHVHQLLCKVLGLSTPATIDDRRGFFDLGMDSLTSVQLRRHLEHDLQKALNSTLTFNYPTIQALTDFLLGELFANTSVNDQPAPSEARHSAAALPASVVASYEQSPADDEEATEDELFEQLAARLARADLNRSN